MIMSIVLALLASTLVLQSETSALSAGKGPLDNPLKGWAPYCQEGSQVYQPYSMVYTYASWRELEPEEGKYRFAEWEKEKWEVPLAKDKQIIFRVYLDYPTQPTGVPQWLLDQGVEETPYTEHGGGKSPDYSNPKLQKAMLRLVDALGKRYDLNPRVAFIQVGLLGYWGEWHTYPREELFAKPTFQEQLIQALRKAFPSKLLMARNPSYPSAGTKPWLGFHDDMIPEDTLGPDEWMFLPALKAAGRQDNWKVAPLGGEMVPHQAKRYMGPEYSSLVSAIKEMKATWIGPYCPAHLNDTTPEFLERSQELVRKMGYQYQWEKVTMPRRLTRGATLTMKLEGHNQGVAPFYYPWPVRLAFVDAKNKVVRTEELKVDIRTWLPGVIKLDVNVPLAVNAGKYRVGIGIIDPWKRSPRIRFANDLPEVEGYAILASLDVS
jgi:hypothetical protein